MDHSAAPLDAKNPVVATAYEACDAKWAAAQQGYFTDPYLKLIAAPHPKRRLPWMNRGQWLRVTATRQAVSGFAKYCKANSLECQLVVVGAGFDTTYFNVREECPNLRCFDVDCEVILKEKSGIMVRESKAFFESEPYTLNEGVVTSEGYRAVCGDLRDWSSVSARLVAAGLKLSVPTIYIAECVLVYLEAQFADQILQGMVSAHKNAPVAVFLYEPVNPEDAFGKMMMKNFAARGASLCGLLKYPTLQTQRDRLSSYGWGPVWASDLRHLYTKALNKESVAKIEALEWLDEMEEWDLMREHYFVAVATANIEKAAIEAYIPFLTPLAQ